MKTNRQTKNWMIEVQFAEDDPTVTLPIESPSVVDDAQAYERLLDEAWVISERAKWAQESANPDFIAALAQDLQRHVPVANIVARFAFAHIGRAYLRRFRKEAKTHGPALIDSNALHLRAETARSGDTTIVLDPPEGWEDRGIANIESLINQLMADAVGPCGWDSFAKWLWTNSVVQAMEDLERECPDDGDELDDRQYVDSVLRQIVDNNNTQHFAELLCDYLDMVLMLFIDALELKNVELWNIELLLGFRIEQPPRVVWLPPSRASCILQPDEAALLRVIERRPEELYRLPPRKFEELIAHIFSNFGYEVEITSETRDGGFDVSAVRRAEIDVRVLIECKRYAPPKLVSRPTAQSLFGVLKHERATKGVIATTSGFTRDAKRFCADHPWHLDARDRSSILEWIQAIRRKGTAAPERTATSLSSGADLLKLT